jgi:hypothetical protein
MKRSLRLLALAFAAVIAAGGCGGHSAEERPASVPMPADLAGVYGGSFPCGNCKQIAATLWLRPDARFFLRQSIVVESGATESSSYSFGHWTWDETSAEIVLTGRGPERRLAPIDAESLKLRTASALEHVLARDPAAPAFADRVQLDGESAVGNKGGATFIQCVTGLEFPIAEVGAYKELRRQHRLLNPRRKVALTSVSAHFANVTANGVTREWLVVDEVLAPIKPGTGCSGATSAPQPAPA